MATKESVEDEERKEAYKKKLADAATQAAEQLQKRRDKKKELNPKTRDIIIAFGRFNPPTTGHARLFARVRDEAERLHADTCIFPSPTLERKRNPLPFRVKTRFLKLLFPDMYFSENEAIKNPFDALHVLSILGYTRVTIIVGADRAEEFRRIANFIRSKGDKRSSRYIVLQDYRVVPIIRADDMSASKLRTLATSGDFEQFCQGVPSSNKGIARQLFTSVRRHMGIKNFSKFVAESDVSTHPKQPTEVDRMKNTQKQQEILLKQRQSNDLLQAKRRELDKKGREDMQKLANGTKQQKKV